MTTELSTRDQIIATAQQLFAELGYEKVSVQKIIDAVGIAKGTFYHHFKSKEELISEIMQQFAQSLVAELLPVVNSESLTSIEKLNQLFEQGVSRKLSGDYSEVMQTMMPLMMNPVNAKLVYDITELTQAKMILLYAPIVQQGVEEGVFHVTFIEETVTMLLLAGKAIQPKFMGLMTLESQAEIESFYREVMTFYQETMERLLGAEKGTLNILSDETVNKVVAFIYQQIQNNNK